MPARSLSFAPAWCLAVLLLTAAPGSSRTLTAADGRVIEADVTGFDGDKVVIRRADTGQVFTLPITTFSAADQRALRAEAAEAAKKPAALPAGALFVELGRVRFDSRKEKRDVPLQGGGTIKDGLHITEEDWGYTITVRNNTSNPIENLRAEYVLFAKVDALKGKENKEGLRRVRKQAPLDSIPASGRISVRSESVLTRKTELKGNVVYSGTGDRDTRDTLHGIWLRIYQGDALVHESASPASLQSSEKWEGAK